MASAGNGQTVNSTGENIFDQADDGGPCVGFLVGVRTAGAQGALVNIPGLHKSGEFFGIPKGQAVIFEDTKQGDITQQIQTVFVKGDGGNTVIDFGVVSKAEIVR